MSNNHLSFDDLKDKKVSMPKDADSQDDDADFFRSETVNVVATKEQRDLRFESLLSDNDIIRRISMNQAKKQQPVDIFETIDIFKAIDNKKDRDELKKVLNTEQYSKGDVLFNYNDLGDRMFVVMNGEITVSLPDPDIPAQEFQERYKEYTDLVEDMRVREEMDRKKQLVQNRMQILEELAVLKNQSSTESLPGVIKGQTKGTSFNLALQSQSKRFQDMSTDAKRKSIQRRSESVVIQPKKFFSKGRSSKKPDSIAGIYEVSENSHDSDDDNSSSADQLLGDIDKIDELNQRTREMYQLGENLKHMFDQKTEEVKPNAAQPQLNTDFDKLRKRVAYLSYGHRKRRSRRTENGSNGLISSQDTIPSNMQIHDQFIKDDRLRRQELSKRRKDKQGQEGGDSGTESDESIRQIKNASKKKTEMIELSELSDAQIAKLSAEQIEHLIMHTKTLSKIPPEEQEAVLNTQWLVPQVTYQKGDTFGERSLLSEANDYRAGTAICTVDCTVKTLVKVDYKRFLEKIELKNQAIKNAFWKVLPFFANWPLKWFNNRLKYAMEEVHVIRNQEVYREGDRADHVYLIWKGEFLLTKKVPVKNEHQVQLEKLIGPNQASLQEHPNTKDLKVVKSALGDQGPKSAAQVNPTPGKSGQQTLTKTKMHGAFKLIALSSGQLFGDDDVINKKPRFATVTCTSSSGVVFRIEAGEFFRKIETVEETKMEIRKQLFSKHQQMQTRLEMIEGVYNIKPAQIMAQVALEKAEGEDFEYMPTQKTWQQDENQRKTLKKPQDGPTSPNMPSSPQQVTRSSVAANRLNQSMASVSGAAIKMTSAASSPRPPIENLSVDLRSSAQPLQGSDSPSQIADFRGNSQVTSYRGQADSSSMPQSQSPRKKQEPGYMKRISSKQPVPTIKRNKGQRPQIEPFEIEEPEEFKHVNKTRKVQYPMVLRRYNVDKKVKEWDVDDFRLAMNFIVFRKDNDDLFNANLKQSGRTSTQKNELETEGRKRSVNSVSILEKPKRSSFIDRTSPQKIVPHGFYSNSVALYQPSSSKRLHLDVSNLDQSEQHGRSSSSIQQKQDAQHKFYTTHENRLNQSGARGQPEGALTPELPKLGQFQARAGSIPVGEQPYSGQSAQVAQDSQWAMRGKRASEAAVPLQQTNNLLGYQTHQKNRMKQQDDNLVNLYSGTQSLEDLGQHQQDQHLQQKTTVFESSYQRNSMLSGIGGDETNNSHYLPPTDGSARQQPDLLASAATEHRKQQLSSLDESRDGAKHLERLRQKSMPLCMTSNTPKRGSQYQSPYSMMRPWMRNQRQNKGNYSLAPSKIYMAHNTGHFPKCESEIEKQRREQSREQREAELMASSVPARILAEKPVKYFSVASTIRRPRRLEKLN